MTEPEISDTELTDSSLKLILVVDDDHTFAEMLQAGLSREGFLAETALNGQEALQKFRQRAPDLIITDLMMPDKGGYDLLRELQGEDTRVPVIVATGRRIDASTEALIRQESNVLDFVQKPIKMVALFGAIHQALKTRPKTGNGSAPQRPPNSW